MGPSPPGLCELTLRSRIQGVAVQEYIPLAGLALTWLAIVVTVGHADAVRLLGAVTFVRAAPALLAPATMPFLRKRMHLPEYRRQAAIVGLAVEAIALAGALLALMGIVALLWSAGQTMLVTLCLLFAPALPVRLIMPLTAARATRGYYRQSLAIAGVVLALAGLVLGADVYGFAILYAVREWLGLGIAWLLAPRQDPNLKPSGPMTWRAVASYSHERGRKVVAYRFSKIFLHVVLGPFGSIAARTGTRIPARPEARAVCAPASGRTGTSWSRPRNSFHGHRLHLAGARLSIGCGEHDAHGLDRRQRVDLGLGRGNLFGERYRRIGRRRVLDRPDAAHVRAAISS